MSEFEDDAARAHAEAAAGQSDEAKAIALQMEIERLARLPELGREFGIRRLAQEIGFDVDLLRRLVNKASRKAKTQANGASGHDHGTAKASEDAARLLMSG